MKQITQTLCAAIAKNRKKLNSGMLWCVWRLLPTVTRRTSVLAVLTATIHNICFIVYLLID